MMEKREKNKFIKIWIYKNPGSTYNLTLEVDRKQDLFFRAASDEESTRTCDLIHFVNFRFYLLLIFNEINAL